MPSRSGSMDNNVNRRVEMNPAYQKERVTTKEMYRHTLEVRQNMFFKLQKHFLKKWFSENYECSFFRDPKICTPRLDRYQRMRLAPSFRPRGLSTIKMGYESKNSVKNERVKFQGTLPRESSTSRLASTEVRTIQTREIPPSQPAMQQYHTT